MKLMIATLALSFTALTTFSTLAQAMPAVGDTASFDGTTVTSQGQAIAFHTVIALAQFDASQNAYLQVSTTTAPGIQPSVQQKWVAAADMINDATVQAILSQCASQGGISETVVVPAGTFPTCRITDSSDGSIYNVGAVSFGIVKAQQGQTNMSLVSFQAGH
jgi:hypothetical protein